MEREGRGERRNKEREGTVEGKRERERGLKIIQEKKEKERRRRERVKEGDEGGGHVAGKRRRRREEECIGIYKYICV